MARLLALSQDIGAFANNFPTRPGCCRGEWSCVPLDGRSSLSPLLIPLFRSIPALTGVPSLQSKPLHPLRWPLVLRRGCRIYRLVFVGLPPGRLRDLAQLIHFCKCFLISDQAVDGIDLLLGFPVVTVLAPPVKGFHKSHAAIRLRFSKNVKGRSHTLYVNPKGI